MTSSLYLRVSVPWYARAVLKAAVLCARASQLLLRTSARLYRTRVQVGDCR